MGWHWHQLDHICTLSQTDNHASASSLIFLQTGCSSWCPTNSAKALKARSAIRLKTFWNYAALMVCCNNVTSISAPNVHPRTNSCQLPHLSNIACLLQNCDVMIIHMKCLVWLDFSFSISYLLLAYDSQQSWNLFNAFCRCKCRPFIILVLKWFALLTA